MKIAVLGLGVMGHGMAGRVLALGHTLTVYNRTQSRAADLAAQGATVAATPARAAQDAEAVITMVSNDQALREVADGPEGFLTTLGAGTLVLQCGTVGPDTVAWLNEQVAARDAALIDAPVMGSKPEAVSGKLWVLAGAEEAVLERAKPVLDCVAQHVYHVGAIGQGTRLKLCSNMITAGVVAALAEGIALIEALGLDPQLYTQVIKDSDLPSRVWGGKAGLMAARDFAPRFSLENMAKDVSLALRLAASVQLPLPQAQASLQSLTAGAEAVGGDRDMAAAFEGVRARTGRRHEEKKG